jgi:hypothetical protein
MGERLSDYANANPRRRMRVAAAVPIDTPLHAHADVYTNRCEKIELSFHGSRAYNNIIIYQYLHSVMRRRLLRRGPETASLAAVFFFI